MNNLSYARKSFNPLEILMEDIKEKLAPLNVYDLNESAKVSSRDVFKKKFKRFKLAKY